MSDDLPRAARRVVEAAAANGLAIEVVQFPQGTRTADDAAAAIRCPVGAIVKSMVLRTDDEAVLVLTSGGNRVDFAKVADAEGLTGLRRADADEVRDATGFAIGGTAPFGHTTSLRTVADRDLLVYPTVWAAAGTPDRVFAIDPKVMVRLTGAHVVEVAAD